MTGRPNIVKIAVLSKLISFKCFYNVYGNTEEPRIAEGRPKLEGLHYVVLRHYKKLQKFRQCAAITDIRRDKQINGTEYPHRSMVN